MNKTIVYETYAQLFEALLVNIMMELIRSIGRVLAVSRNKSKGHQVALAIDISSHYVEKHLTLSAAAYQNC